MASDKMKIDRGVRPNEVFYKKMGDTKYYCRYCGHGHTEKQIAAMMKKYMRGIAAVQEAVRSSFGGDDNV